MQVLQQLLNEELLIDAVEFGTTEHFYLIIRKKGQRKSRTAKLTLSQLLILLSAMDKHGRILQEAIDESYERYHNDYMVKYMGKRIRIDIKDLLGKSYSLLYESSEYFEAA